MPRHPLVPFLRILPLIAAASLGGCAHHQVALVNAPAVVAVVDAPPLAPPAPSPINAHLSTAATVWHLRAALNVAALGCRAPTQAMLASQYNALLVTQKTAFAAAQTGLSAEFRASGGKWQDRYDHAMTQLYNFFATAQAHDRFCAAATAVMADAQRVAPGALTALAAGQLATLDAAFATSGPTMPFAPIAPASGFASRAVIAVAAGPSATRPTTHPRLDLDLSALKAD